MATNKQAFKLYFKMSLAASCGYYAFLHQRCQQIRKEYTDFDSI